MPVTIRLLRIGKKNHPAYRVIAIDKRKKRNGVYVDKLGLYNPMKEPFTFEIDEKKLKYWCEKGALISNGMQKLLNNRKKAKTD